MNENKKIGIISDWIYVYKDFMEKKDFEDLRYTLYTKDNGIEIPVTINLYAEYDKNIIAIPRYCKFGLYAYNLNSLNDLRSEGEDIDIEIKVPPRDHYQEDAIKCIIDNDHGIIHAKTAFGKTYVAINAIATLKKRALILMHKRDLMEQWKDDILNYTNLKDDDVQIFTGNEDNFISGKAITITTVQNIEEKIRKNNIYVRDLFSKENFGITFYDECHTTVGPQLNTFVSRYIFSKRLYGLSATPKRGDEGDIAIKDILGNVIYNDQRKMLPVYISFAPIEIEVPQKTRQYLFRFKNTFTLKYSQWMQKNEEFVNYCTNLIYSLIKIDKKILVVAQYKEILNTIYNSTFSLLGDNKLDVDKIRIVHGSSKAKFKDVKNISEEELKNFNCIFTTSSYFSSGLSINWLNTIVYLTSPSANSLCAIPQLVGRIVRDYKDKKYVNIIDIFNKSFDIDLARAKKREASYKNFNYIILPINDKVINDTDIYINDMIEKCDIITEYGRL